MLQEYHETHAAMQAEAQHNSEWLVFRSRTVNKSLPSQPSREKCIQASHPATPCNTLKERQPRKLHVAQPTACRPGTRLQSAAHSTVGAPCKNALTS